MSNSNIGWLFYKDYYSGIGTERQQQYEAKNLKIFGQVFDKNDVASAVKKEFNFCLTTTYPGVLIGSGYTHEAEKNKDDAQGELKLGFFFDHTTGMPLIPGSSVKGLLRSVFPSSDKLDKNGEIKMKNSARRKEWIKELLCEISSDLANMDVDKLEKQIFDGVDTDKTTEKKTVYLSVYERDIFHDAVITEGNKKGKFLGNDYITPHGDNPLKNPTPLQFMKILPEVTFEFRFDLKASVIDGVTITAEQKKTLFKTIIKEIGIGAKTNVGYGQME